MTSETDPPSPTPLPDTAVVIMTRAPVPGRCKTRLIPMLGRRGAARLHEKLTRATIRKAARTATPVIAAQPDARHHFFATLRGRGHTVHRQRGTDLGQRMRLAIRRALNTHRTVIVIGTDCPSLTSDDLRALAQACPPAGAACIPATDGGYVALAAQADHPALFRRIAWGTPRVLRQTRQAAKQAGIALLELERRPDLDLPADYVSHRRRGLLPRRF